MTPKNSGSPSQGSSSTRSIFSVSRCEAWAGTWTVALSAASITAVVGRRCLRRGAQRAHDQAAQLLHALAVLGRNEADRHAQPAGERIALDRDAERGGLVRHVQHQHERDAELRQLREQVQLALELRGVQHHQHDVDALLAQEGRDDLLVLGEPAQVVDPGQVDELHHLVAEQQLRAQQIDRDARPVADLGLRAGQAVEQGRLARVGHADQRDAFHALPRPGRAGARRGRAA